MIRSFRCKRTEKLHRGEFVKAFDAIERSARKRLKWLHAAGRLEDLRNIRGNHLEALAGHRKGQHSIRINDQWRICFCWRDGHAWDVEIVDYH